MIYVDLLFPKIVVSKKLQLLLLALVTYKFGCLGQIRNHNLDFNLLCALVAQYLVVCSTILHFSGNYNRLPNP